MSSKNPGTDAAKSGAALRVMGAGLDLPGITKALGTSPTHVHRQGELGPSRRPYEQDMWMLESESGVDPSEPLEAHLQWLRRALASHLEFLSSLRGRARVDVYCRLTCYSDQSSLALSPDALKVFIDLQVPLEVSLIFIPDD